jgi:hypothetical protein
MAIASCLALALNGITAAAQIPQQFTQPFPRDAQDHPGRSWRLEKTTIGGWGDTDVAKRTARHVVAYAVQRYKMDDVVKPEDIERANREMYDFLSWKYGNPSAIAAQWISTGYGHFDSHADEAAGALLGIALPGPGPQVVLPKEVSDWLKAQVDSAAAMQSDPSQGGICAALHGQLGPGSLENNAGTGPSANGGAPPEGTILGVACDLLVPIVAEAAQLAIDRIGISAAALKGKTYDVKTADINLMMYAKRNPPTYAARNIKVRGLKVGVGAPTRRP